jgi:hypothetical protein
VHPGPRFIYRQPRTREPSVELVEYVRCCYTWSDGLRWHATQFSARRTEFRNSGADRQWRSAPRTSWRAASAILGVETGKSHWHWQQSQTSYFVGGALSRKNLLLAYHEEWPDAETFGPGGDLAGGACRVCAKLVSGERKATSSWAPP